MRVGSTSTAGYQMALQLTTPNNHPKNLDDATELLATGEDGEAYSVHLSITEKGDPNAAATKQPVIITSDRLWRISSMTTEGLINAFYAEPPSNLDFYEKKDWTEQNVRNWVNDIMENDREMFTDYTKKRKNYIESGQPEKAFLPSNFTMEDYDYYTGLFFGTIVYDQNYGGTVNYGGHGISPEELPEHVKIPDAYWDAQTQYESSSYYLVIDSKA